VSIEVGDRFGRWTVTRRSGSKLFGATRRALWAVRCECGHRAVIPGRYLSEGISTGCSTSTSNLAEEAAACRQAWEREQRTQTLRAELRAKLEEHDAPAELVADVEAVLESHAEIRR
jgi:hypothetical protein